MGAPCEDRPAAAEEADVWVEVSTATGAGRAAFVARITERAREGDSRALVGELLPCEYRRHAAEDTCECFLHPTAGAADRSARRAALLGMIYSLREVVVMARAGGQPRAAEAALVVRILVRHPGDPLVAEFEAGIAEEADLFDVYMSVRRDMYVLAGIRVLLVGVAPFAPPDADEEGFLAFLYSKPPENHVYRAERIPK